MIHADDIFIQENGKEKYESLKLYLFSDVNEYISNFVSPLFVGKFKCISFTWSPKYVDAIEAVKSLYEPASKIYHPSAVIMNMGLHDLNGYVGDQLQELMKMTDEFHNKYNTMYIMHSPSHVMYTASEYHGNFTPANIERVIDTVSAALPSWKAVNSRYLDIWNLTRAMHMIPKCSRPDGVHFAPICVYQALVTQWDFNWLKYLGVIRHSLSDDELEDHYKSLYSIHKYTSANSTG